ncbi:MAG TPA: hypothetical protein DCZ72_06025 [Armatimonadetes bacterium]|nr:hypothetical protein [Armatimonadota bacterium]
MLTRGQNPAVETAALMHFFGAVMTVFVTAVLCQVWTYNEVLTATSIMGVGLTLALVRGAAAIQLVYGRRWAQAALVVFDVLGLALGLVFLGLAIFFLPYHLHCLNLLLGGGNDPGDGETVQVVQFGREW